MCLRVKNIDIKTADSEIACFKVVLRRGLRYRTPFRETRLPWLVMLGKKRFEAKGPEFQSYYDDVFGRKIVDKGAIHTFSFVSDARAMAKIWGGHAEVWECVIPVGEKYLSGNDNEGHPCLGSRSIIFKKKVCKY